MKQYSFPLIFHRLAALCVLAMAITIGSCAFGDREDVVPGLTTDEEQVIYVAGRYNQHACVWIVKETLPFRVMLPEPPFTVSSHARAIAVDNGRVIVSGSYTSAGTTYPILWINGMAVTFSVGGNSMMTVNGDSLAVVDGKIYMTAIGNNRAMVIANGVPVSLPEPPGTMHSFAHTVSVEEPHVIVGGLVNNGANDRACLWIDGQFVPMDNTAIASAVYGVKIIGGHIYSAGYINTTSGTLWVDGVQNILNPGENTTVYGLHVNNGVPYMAGRYVNVNNYAALWIGGGGGRQILSLNSTNATALGVYVRSGGLAGDSVLVTGRLDDAGVASAYLWINSMSVRLDGAGLVDNTEARAAVVGPKVWE